MPLNILQQSPHDLESPRGEVASSQPSPRWRASRYNVRATTEDGSLVLWNTVSGAMSVFKPGQVEMIKTLLRNSGVEPKSEGWRSTCSSAASWSGGRQRVPAGPARLRPAALPDRPPGADPPGFGGLQLPLYLLL